ncbi:hypothetical protein [Tenacibaculum sp. UWU-22]|uniref:mechanosensitive ion channel family protein n=1 Tax=Tenacibaculum sp. UWU-22 TaxID=3234187 RepID=UPI0034DB1162
MSEFKNALLQPFQSIFQDILAALPTVFKFIGFVIFSWLFIKLVIYALRKILAKTNIDKWSEKLSETKIFGNTTINVVFTNLILNVFKWFLVLIFIMAGANIFGMDTVSNGIKSFFAYLPRLLTALGIFVAGVYVGTLVKKAIQTMLKSLEITGGNLLGNIAFYLIVVFLSITALDQAGVNTSVIKSNLTLIIASILVSFTIAFGLGSRDIIKRMLYVYYSRKNFQIGQNIQFNDVKGTIVSIDNICMVINTREGKVVLPVTDVVNSKITILS